MAENQVNLSTLRTANRMMGNQVGQQSQKGDTNAPSSFGNGITNLFYGHNFMQSPLPMPMDKLSRGYVFFTRPQLNLQKSNLKHDSFFYPLLTKNSLSVHRAIRCTLDPRLQWYEGVKDMQGENMFAPCPLIDPCNPFIPMLANTAISVVGFPDKVINFYRSPDDLYKGNHSMADSATHMHGAYTVTLNTRQIRSRPTYRLIDNWIEYMGKVVEGVLSPYGDILMGGLLDYNTRIYRVILDDSMQYMEEIGCTGASAPASLPRAQMFDYNTESPLNDLGQQMSFQFESNGFFHGEEVLDAFNRLQEAFHPGMRGAAARAKYMRKIDRSLLPCFNCRAYPRIDPKTREMEWWTTVEYYQQIIALTDNVLESLTMFAAGAKTVEQLAPFLERQNSNLSLYS